MFSVGEFASVARVTVRQLHYYDEIGLLQPAEIDPHTGRRAYAPDQIELLTRILRLRDLGLRLAEIIQIVRGELGPADERALLESRRDELVAEIDRQRSRLARLQAHLRALDAAPGETHQERPPVDYRRIGPRRVACARAVAPGWGWANITPVIGPLFDRLAAALQRADVPDPGPAIAEYEADETGDGSGVRVTAAFGLPETVAEIGLERGPGFDVITLPPIEQAAVITHRGPLTGLGRSWEALLRQARTDGYQVSGVCREFYLASADQPHHDWVIELHQPVRARTDRLSAPPSPRSAV